MAFGEPRHDHLLTHPARRHHCSNRHSRTCFGRRAGRPCKSVAVGSSQSSGSSAIAPGTFLRAGSVDAVKQLCGAGGLDRVVVNNVLSGVQQRNLEAAWG